MYTEQNIPRWMDENECALVYILLYISLCRSAKTNKKSFASCFVFAYTNGMDQVNADVNGRISPHVSPPKEIACVYFSSFL